MMLRMMNKILIEIETLREIATRVYTMKISN